jgi:hypothetical protein
LQLQKPEVVTLETGDSGGIIYNAEIIGS